MNNAVNFNFMLVVLEHYVARKSALADGRGIAMPKYKYNYIKS